MRDGDNREHDRLYDLLTRGFEGINRRLDVQNGRIGKSETALTEVKEVGADLRARMTNIEHEVFRDRRSGLERRTDLPPAPSAQDSGPWTKRELSMAGGALILISWIGFAALRLVEMAGGKAWAAVSAAVKGQP